MANFAYKSFCWSIGTTSFRTVDFNVRIERQLALLDEFWALPENAKKKWRANNRLQCDYYRFMQKYDFVDGDAPNPAKDAREKTSGLAVVGLIDNERRLTDAGEVLLQIAQRGDFSRDNPLQIPNDSFIYLKQLIKTHIDIDGRIVRPYAVTVYALSQLGCLSANEFTYLLPLCTSREHTQTIIKAISDLREGKEDIDNIITARLMAMDNYKEALAYFLNSGIVTEDVFCEIGMNRKSGAAGIQAYDKPYYQFFELIRKVVLEHDKNSVWHLYEQSRKIKSKPGNLWRQYLFNTSSRRKIERIGLDALNDVPLLSATDEHELRRLFFERMHLFKAKATLNDYADLNMRYFKTTDTVIFADGKIQLDVLPKCWLDSIADKLFEVAFTKSKKLADDVNLEKISSFLEIDTNKLYADLERIYGVKITTAAEATAIIANERYRRLNALIDERFSKEVLIELFNKFECREDNEIRRLVTNNADIPTIFEYVLGLAWYLISGRTGDVLEYMNLSLEADLLPRTHAQGGSADIEYLYEASETYPPHCLLLEATLADNTRQRRMEMEPVSRHLGEYILNKGDKNTYAVFVSTTLHHNVISDFHNRRTYQYYSEDYKNCVDGLKILPLSTGDVKLILEKEIKYTSLYLIFEAAYRSNTVLPKWYELEIAGRLREITECKIKTDNLLQTKNTP